MAAVSVSIFKRTVRAGTGVTVTACRGLTLAGAIPSAGGAGYPAEFSGVAGDPITINMLGTAEGEIGAAVSFNALLEFNSSGQYITRTTGIPVARAMEAGTTAGQRIEIFLIPH
jgi:hypothetical protein